MTYSTYFEIGGHVFSCDTSVIARPPLSFAAASSLRSARGDSSETVVSPQAVRTAEGGFDYLKAMGHKKRAISAARLALIFAAADGPLPIGDVLAVSVLAGYAGFETAMAVKTITGN